MTRRLATAAGLLLGAVGDGLGGAVGGERVMFKIRGLWRFDGDEEPVRVSRRRFLFLGGVAAVGAMLPASASSEFVMTPIYDYHALLPPGRIDVEVVAAYIDKLNGDGTWHVRGALPHGWQGGRDIRL